MTDAARLQIVVEADTSKAESGLQSLGQRVASFGQSFAMGLGIGAGIEAIQAGIGVISGSFGALKSSVIDFNQQLDSSRAVFARYFEGNTQIADQFLNTLKGFASTTPFEFKDLSQLAIRLQNANTNANDIIPTIKAIGNAASASGSLSQASLDRITLALTQMQMKGKVTGEEMLQLVEAGVPAWNLLAEATGKPIPVLQEMASKGQISADVLIKAFRGAYENAGLMEGASKSLEGALSTIWDVGTQAFADIGRSVYELATSGFNQLATFLSSEQVQTWANAARVGVESVVGGIRSLVDALAPVGETIATAFGQFTQGDFAGGFGTIGAAIQTALAGVVESIQGFAAQMFGAGTNLVSELAGGILDGASSILQGAIDTVASTIAAFLIGQSPPPDGPLARIREGGANVIAAWGEGAASAADRAVKPAADKIAGGLDELKAAGRGVEDAIRDIGRAIAEIDDDTADLKRQVADVKDTYQDQLDPLEAQLKSLTDIKDLEAERHKIELSLEEAQLRQAEIAAQGDPRRLAELRTLQQQLKARQDQVKIQREQEDLRKAQQGTETDRLKDQLEAQKLAREEADLREKLGKAKPEDRRAIQDRLDELAVRRQIAAAEEKERQQAAARKREDLDFRTGELEIQQQIAGLADKEALARIKARQDEIKAERDRMSLAEQQGKLERDRLALPIRQEIERIKAEQESTLEPLSQQLAALGRQKEDLGQQRQQWQFIKQEISQAAAETREQEAATKKATKAAEDAAKEAAKNAPRAAVDKTFTPDAIAEGAINKAKESGAKLAERLREGFVSWLTETPLLSAGTIAGAIFGAGQGAALGASLGSIVPVIGTAIGGLLGAAIGAAIGGIGAATLLAPLQKKLDEIVGPAGAHFAQQVKSTFDVGGIGAVIELLTQRIGAAISAGVPLLAGKLAEWANALVDWTARVAPQLLARLQEIGAGVVGWIERHAGPIADRLYQWALALVGWVQTGGLDLLSKLADLSGKVLAWIGENATKLAGKLLDWATAFVEWVGPKIPELLGELGKLGAKMVEWLGTHLGDLLDGLGKWALAFVAWVAPKIPPLLAELAELAQRLLRWAAFDALPAIVKKLAEWGVAFYEWVAPRVPIVLEELGKLLAKLIDWQINVALPKIVEKLTEWGTAFWKWVLLDVLPNLPIELLKIQLAIIKFIGEDAGPAIVKKLIEWELAFLNWIATGVVPNLAQKLGAILTEVSRWIGEKVGSIAADAARLGHGMLEGIQRGLTEKWGDLANWINDNIGKRLPDWMQKILGIHSPSTVFADIGRNLIDGLIVGMQSKSGELLESARRLMDFGNIGQGPGMDLIRQIGEMAQRIGGPEFARAAMAVASSETSGGSDLDQGPGRAKGPFQFDPGGELQHFARLLGLSLEEAGRRAILNPLEAARYALEGHGSGFSGPGYLGRAISEGLRRNLHGPDLAEFASRVGQRPYGELWREAGNWYERLFPGLADGAIVRARAGGLLARIAEGGRDEAVIPLPRDWETRPPRDWMQSPTTLAAGDTYIIDARGAVVYDGSKFEDMLVGALDRASRHQRIVKVTL